MAKEIKDNNEFIKPEELINFKGLIDAITARIRQTESTLELKGDVGDYKLVVSHIMEQVYGKGNEEKKEGDIEKLGEDYFDGPSTEIAEKMKEEGICVVSEIKGEKVILKVTGTKPWHAIDQKDGVDVITKQKTYAKIAEQSGTSEVPAGKLYTPWGRGRLLNVTTKDGCVWIEAVVPVEGIEGEVKGINQIAEALGIPSQGEEFNGLSVGNEQIYFVKEVKNKDLEK